MRKIRSRRIRKDELREEIGEILKRHDTVFGRDSRFIAKKIENRGYNSVNNYRVGQNCDKMRDAIKVGTHGSSNRVKWRHKEVIEE